MDKIAEEIPHFCNDKFPESAKMPLKAPYQNNILVGDRRKHLQGRLENANNDPSKGYQKKDNWNEKLPKIKKEATFPKLNPFKPDIDAWLMDDRKARRKQRHTAKRVYDRLIEKYGADFDCSYRIVADYMAIRKKERFGEQKGFLPLEHIPGEAQADFGDADFYENGKLHSGKYFNLSFPNSNKGYTQVYKGENQECLFEGLKAIFEYIGGVPTRIWFDNASTMVTKVIKGGFLEYNFSWQNR